MATKSAESNGSAEKEGVRHSPTGEKTEDVLPLPYTPQEPLSDEINALARKVFLKYDFILVVPVLVTFFFFSFIDKVNIGNARVAGLQADLNMTDRQFSFALTISYIPYLVAQLPTGLLVKRVGANILLPALSILWGLTTALQGLVTTYGGLITARFFLGLFEAGLLPGILLVTSRFYKRDQIQFRMTLMFTSVSLAGAFSGLLAFAILGLEGRAGYKGWQWIFILEGITTVAFGLLSFFVLPRTPTSSRLLTEKEKQAIQAVLEHDWTPDSEEEPFQWKHVVTAFTTPHVILVALLAFFGGNTLASLSYFVPTILRSMGYSAVRTQLMSVPPFAVTFVLSVAIAFLADRWRQRGYSLFLSGVVAVVGYSMFLTSTDIPVLYGSIFLQTLGSFTSASAATTWNVNNVQPHYKRSTSIGFESTVANFGGVMATWIYDDPPRFAKATKINIASSVVIAVLAIVNRVWLVMQNKRKERERAQRRPLGSEEEEEAERRRLRDDHPDFVYTL